MDAQGSSLTLRVLTCPPPSCIGSGCPGHEYRTKGLDGCGVDSANAAVGTEFAVPFGVFDHDVLPLYASRTRYVRVVSPCADGESYCPDVPSHLCGTAPCSLRADLGDPPPPEPPAVVFGAVVIPGTVSADGSLGTAVALSVDMVVMCGSRPSPPVTWCSSDRSLDCIASVEWPGGGGGELVRTSHRVGAQSGHCTAREIGAGGCLECSLAALNAGNCHAGAHVFVFQAFAAGGMAGGGRSAAVRVAVLKRLAAVEASVKGTIDASGMSDVGLAAVLSAFGGQVPLTNELLWASREALQAEVQEALAAPTCAAFVREMGDLASSLHVEVGRTDDALSAISSAVAGDNRVSVQVRRPQFLFVQSSEYIP